MNKPTEPEPADQYNDTNERDIESKQSRPVTDSEAMKRDDEIDAESVKVLPGTGGPDDEGEVELDPEDYHPEG